MLDRDNNYDDSPPLPYYDNPSSREDVSTAQIIDVQQMNDENSVNAIPTLEQGLPTPATSVRRSGGNWLYSLIGALIAVLVIAAGTFSFSVWPLPILKIGFNAPPQTTAGPEQSRFRYGSCPFSLGRGIVEGQQVKCGVLLVPEDRNHPQGRIVQLAVAIFKSRNAYPFADPVLYLGGGPGDGTVTMGSGITIDNLNDVTLGHDMILIDQRGTGLSTPSLDCFELANLQSSGPQGNFGRDSLLPAVQACHDRLVSAGINLNAYTTIANATDIHDLIHALGYKQVDLLGTSYGTRLALTLVRLFPDDIRSDLLDSVVPTQINLYNNFPATMQHVFNVLFSGCAANADCNSAYPQLQNTFYATVADLNAHPVKIALSPFNRVVPFDGNTFVNWVFLSLYSASYIPEIPAAIMQVSHRNYGLIRAFYTPFNLYVPSGMFFSIECGEDMAFTSLQALNTSANVLPPEIREGVLAQLQTMFTACQNWGVSAVPAVQKQPVTSLVPTLILSGEYDPITPTSNAQLAVQTLSKGFLLVFPAIGHGVLYADPCPLGIAQAFVANPGTKPDARCIADMPEPDFQ